MIDLLYNFELSSKHTKVKASALQTFADVLNVDHKKKTSVPDVLPSGKYFKRCTAKHNATSQDHYQQMVAFMLASMTRL